MLAQLLTEQPRMFNHHRGLWGYTGTAADGLPLSIQSTGMGGPSAAIVVSELITLGARRLIRVGTCGGLVDSLSLGDLVVVSDCLSADGASRALGADGVVGPDRELTAALLRAGDGIAIAGRAVSTDLFYDSSGREREWRAAGAIAVEMEAATLFAIARAREAAAACLLLVSDVLADPARVRIAADELVEAEQRLGRLAAAALVER
jgi:uridine phosphorylase